MRMFALNIQNLEKQYFKWLDLNVRRKKELMENLMSFQARYKQAASKIK
jgi:hypothetical protein